MAGEDLLAKFDDLTKRFKAEFEEIIEEERAKLKAEVEPYNVEKERMKAITVSDDDIIPLNVGGQKITTKRSTLCQVEGSLLASMFSGRWEDRLGLDKDGCIFFDFNPDNFVLILDYLRTKKIGTPENTLTAVPNVPPDQVTHFNTLVEYLGLSEEIAPEDLEPKDIFNQHSDGVTIQEGGTTAVHAPQAGSHYTLGENIYEAEIIHWKLKLESFQNNEWMFVGVLKGDTTPSHTNSYGWSGLYGWALGNTGQVHTNGTYLSNPSLKNLCKQGDTVEVILDCTSSKLSLLLTSGQSFHHTLPGSETWRLHVNLHGVNDKIRIV